MEKSELTFTFNYISPRRVRSYGGSRGYSLIESNRLQEYSFESSTNTLSWLRERNTSFKLFSVANSATVAHKEALSSILGLGFKFNAIGINFRKGDCYLPLQEIGEVMNIDESDHNSQTLLLTFQSIGPEPFQASPLQLAKCKLFFLVRSELMLIKRIFSVKYSSIFSERRSYFICASWKINSTNLDYYEASHRLFSTL